MTPKDKAQELTYKYINASFNCKDCDMPYCDMKCTSLNIREAKQCALIAVDEMLNYFSKETFMMAYPEIAISEVNYWKEVKQEIEKL